MKKLLLLVFIVLLASCVHKQTQDVTMKGTVEGIHINIRGFLQLTAKDIRELEKSSRKGKAESELTLDWGLKAHCKSESCRVETAFGKSEMGRKDILEFQSLNKKAQKSGKEESFTEGPVTVRCTDKKCLADLLIDDNKPHEIEVQGKATVTTDYSGLLLGSFIQGILNGASHR